MGGIDPVSIDILPDEALLEIFTFYSIEPLHPLDHKTIPFSDRWRTLVHVCRRWRYIVFASPRGLDLCLVCTAMTPVKKMLNIWPKLPLAILGSVREVPSLWTVEVAEGHHFQDLSDPVEGVDNIIAALERTNRIREISFCDMPTSLLETLATSMQEPLPDLTSLLLKPLDETSPPILADSFLGGSAPRLRTFVSRGITILSLRNLLLSAHNLVTLHLRRIPHYGYISPEALVTCLSAMPNLKEFHLGFQSPLSRPDQASGRLLPLTRVVLPSLTYFDFKGVSEYLEDIVAQIDLPLLDRIRITFFNQLIFNTPHLRQFINREESLEPYKQVAIRFHSDRVAIQLSAQQDPMDPPPKLTLEVSCIDLEWQLSSVVQFCGSSLLPLRTTEQLGIFDERFPRLHQQDNIESTQWLELLYPFIHVKELRIYNNAFARRVATSLQELAGDNIPEVLSAVQHFSMSMQLEHLQECIGKLVDAIQASFGTGFYSCPDCGRNFRRRRDVERHVLSHLPYWTYCVQPGCGWTGNRHSVLRAHFYTTHPGVPFSGHGESMIYDAHALVKQRLNGEITLEQAECEAHLSFQSKAAELGKQGIWREGRKRGSRFHVSRASHGD
jgi:F-box-like/Zinc finger, C2H2 type